jgi:C_GCAxxG_C_C family probable redox protein
MKDPQAVGDQAEEMFYQGFNCCEGVATALAEALGRRCPGCLPALGTGMGGGLGHTGGACGAVTGGAMAVGLATTLKKFRDHSQEKQWANAIVAEFVDAFGREFNYIECSRLLNLDLRSPAAMDRYRDGGCKERCAHFVNFAASWVARRLAEEGL